VRGEGTIWTERLVRGVVEQLGVDADIIKVIEISEMEPYGVVSIHAIVVDEHLILAGGIPTTDQVQR